MCIFKGGAMTLLVEHYTKGENVDTEVEWNIPGCTITTPRLDIVPSTKVRDAIDVALEKLTTEKQLFLVGAGPAVLKTVSIVEIVKKRMKQLSQITHLNYKIVEEYWEPKLDGLDRLKVTREIPAIGVLLSKEPLDASTPGYQAPGLSVEELWKCDIKRTPRKPKASNYSKGNKNKDSDSYNRSNNKSGNWRMKPLDALNTASSNNSKDNQSMRSRDNVADNEIDRRLSNKTKQFKENQRTV